MKISKKVKFGIFGILGLVFLFFLVLIVHIGIMVHERGPIAMATVQMARADFQKPVDSMQAQQIQTQIKAQKGVKSTYFNIKDGIVIYTFDNRENTAGSIYKKAIKTFSIPSARYTVSKEDLANGCPVMNNNSFYGKLTAVVSKVVN